MQYFNKLYNAKQSRKTGYIYKLTFTIPRVMKRN